MKAAPLLAVAVAQARGLQCNVTGVQEGMNHAGEDYAHFPSESAQACQQRCCTDALTCGAFTWTSYQLHDTGACMQGTACCWLKSAKPGAYSAKDNCTSGEVQLPMLMSPRFTEVSILADDPTGNLRDPSGMVQDPRTGKWHFWVVYVPGTVQPGWSGYLHHYSADAFDGPFTNQGLALNHSSDPTAFDYNGMFSPSALYDEVEDMWYLHYSGTGANFSSPDPISAQLVASAKSPEGPWTRLGLATHPTGSDEAGWEKPWNARRCDSGRAMRINGRRGYWTKGCNKGSTPGGHRCEEGAYFPQDPSSWKPPYSEWPRNPIYKTDGSTAYSDKEGYENCEFFKGPAEELLDGQRVLHVICQGHTTGQPHFVTDATGLSWTFLELVDTNPAKEPTPVYRGAIPGDEAEVTHFIARRKTNHLVVALYKIDWAPIARQELPIIV